MQGDAEILDILNDVLTAELTAINQYFIHSKMCDNWGYKRLYKKLREESIEEMKDADRLIERILYLDGLPNLQRLGKVHVGQSVTEQLRLDLELEKDAIRRLNDGIELCRGLGDNGSRELLEDLLEGEEDLDWDQAQVRRSFLFLPDRRSSLDVNLG